MTKDKLSRLLKDYNSHRGSGEFSSTAEFKEKFFKAAKDEKAEPKRQGKTILWLSGAISAVAAAILFSVVPFYMVTNVPVEKIKQTFSSGTCQLMRKLKNVFPEKNVGLCLINGELKTFDAYEKAPRDILVNYSIQRKSDGKVIKLSVATSSNNSSELNSKQVKGSIWVYQPDSKVLTVDTDLALQLDTKTTIKINESNLLKLNHKQFVSEFEYHGRKYQLFQSACRI